jgi:hypothetical protein
MVAFVDNNNVPWLAVLTAQASTFDCSNSAIILYKITTGPRIRTRLHCAILTWCKL